MIALLALSSFAAAGQNPKKEDEVSTLIASARFLEQKPLDKEAKKVRSWALTWVIATDKVTVTLCTNYLSGMGDKYKYRGEATAHYAIGMAAFKLANPGKDEPSAQLAGLETVLLAYEAMVKEEPKAKEPFLDELLAKRAAGTLAQYVVDKKCEDKK